VPCEATRDHQSAVVFAQGGVGGGCTGGFDTGGTPVPPDALSGNKGFKHISKATTSEWLSFKHRRRHGISESVTVSDLQSAASS
jgi:hypothetical protein